MEFKLLKKEDELLKGAQQGLAQINQKCYSDYFKDFPQTQRALKIGLAFSGKRMAAA